MEMNSGMKEKRIYLKLILSIFIVAVLVFGITVKADPLPYRPDREPSLEGGFWTAIINLPYNLFFLLIISIFLLKFSSFGETLKRSPKSYVGRLLLVCLVVTIIGAIIDQLLVATSIHDLGLARFSSSHSPELVLDLTSLVIALILIFISFFISCLFILDMKKKNASITGLSMVAVNALFWYIQTDGYFAFNFASLFCVPGSIIISIFLLMSLLTLLKRKEIK